MVVPDTSLLHWAAVPVFRTGASEQSAFWDDWLSRVVAAGGGGAGVGVAGGGVGAFGVGAGGFGVGPGGEGVGGPTLHVAMQSAGD